MTMSAHFHSVEILGPSHLHLHTTLVPATHLESPLILPPSTAVTNVARSMANKSATGKSVSFGRVIAELVVENGRPLSQKEKERRWLCNEDLSSTMNECRDLVNDLKEDDSANIFTYRGLEMVDPEAVVRRRRHHTDVTSAVLIEQREQRSKAACNPKAIRKAYRKLVIESIKEALENAYIDEKAVKEYLSTTIAEMEEYRKSGEYASPVRRPSLFRPVTREGSSVSTKVPTRFSFCAATLLSSDSAADEI